MLRTTLAVLCCAATPFALAEVSRYDIASGVLTIPTVGAGAAVYSQVTLRNRGNFVFDVQGGTLLPLGGPAVATFETSSGVLRLPAVQVGTQTFLDVTLRDGGGLVFALQSGTELPQATRSEIDALMRANEQLFATAVPPDGAARMALTDPCALHNGRTRAYDIADIDADLATYRARDAYQVGRTMANVQVLALRNGANPDGSTRREIDIEYDIVYRDGTATRGAAITLISGSSTGSCATPMSSASLRFFGNRQLVDVGVRARNLRDERYSRTTGAVLSPSVFHRREIFFAVADAMGNATYAVVTGPGPSGSVGGFAKQFSLKLLSPRLLRSAPELQGRNENYLNWRDDDIWRACRVAGSNVPVAEAADCAGMGTQGAVWGFGPTSTPNAAADQGFADQGWVAGGWYRFDVYNDDGWKTVNGHAGRTPVATYWAQLDRLPFTFVQMAPGNGAPDVLPRLNPAPLTSVQVRANAFAATPVPVSVTWGPLPPMPQGTFGLSQGWEIHQGPRTGNANGAAFPAFRTQTRQYPGSTALAQPAWPVTPLVPTQLDKTYLEFTLLFTDRNNGHLLTMVTFR